MGNCVCWYYREEPGQVVVSEEEVEVAGLGAQEEEIGDHHDLEVVWVVLVGFMAMEVRARYPFAGRR